MALAAASAGLWVAGFAAQATGADHEDIADFHALAITGTISALLVALLGPFLVRRKVDAGRLAELERRQGEYEREQADQRRLWTAWREGEEKLRPVGGTGA